MSNIRFMNPCTIQCDSCGEVIPPRRKFNGSKEILKERYLDKVKIYTISFHCPQCHNLLVLQTDPQRADYITKTGCHRLFQNKDSKDHTNTNTDDNDKTKQIEDRLKILQRQQLQMDELTKIQELQSKIHQQEMLATDSVGIANVVPSTRFGGLPNSTIPDLGGGFSNQFSTKQSEEKSTTINTTDLIKLRTTTINSKKKNNNNNNSSTKSPNKNNSSLSLGVIVKRKKKKGKIIKKDKA